MIYGNKMFCTDLTWGDEDNDSQFLRIEVSSIDEQKKRFPRSLISKAHIILFC